MDLVDKSGSKPLDLAVARTDNAGPNIVSLYMEIATTHPSRWTPRTPEKTTRHTIPGAPKKRKRKRAPGDVDIVRL